MAASRKAASVLRAVRPAAVAALAVLLVATGAALYLTAAPSDSALTALVLVGRH